MNLNRRHFMAAAAAIAAGPEKLLTATDLPYTPSQIQEVTFEADDLVIKELQDQISFVTWWYMTGPKDLFILLPEGHELLQMPGGFELGGIWGSIDNAIVQYDTNYGLKHTHELHTPKTRRQEVSGGIALIGLKLPAAFHGLLDSLVGKPDLDISLYVPGTHEACNRMDMEHHGEIISATTSDVLGYHIRTEFMPANEHEKAEKAQPCAIFGIKELGYVTDEDSIPHVRRIDSLPDVEYGFNDLNLYE